MQQYVVYTTAASQDISLQGTMRFVRVSARSEQSAVRKAMLAVLVEATKHLELDTQEQEEFLGSLLYTVVRQEQLAKKTPEEYWCNLRD